MSKESKSELILLLVAIIWGTGFISSKIAVNTGMSVYDILIIRFALSSILLYFICIKRKIKIEKTMIESGFILGLLLALGYISQTLGVVYTTPAKNALLTGLNIIFIPYISYIIFKTKLEKRTLTASFFAFLGIALLSVDTTSLNIISFNIGDILSIICAFTFALHIIFTGVYVRKIDALALSFIQFLFATFFTLILRLLINPPLILSFSSIVSSMYMAIFCTFIGYSLQFIAQKNVKASKAGIILSLEVVFAIIISLILGYDKFKISILVGFSFIFFAIMILETKISLILRKDKNERN